MQDLAIKTFKKSKTINNLKSKNKFLRQTAVEGYDPMQIPGDPDKAYKHMGASRVGREAQVGQLGSSETLQICPCCGKYVQKEPLSIKQDVIELSFLGSGYPMYFEFIRFCIILMVVLLFFNGLYGLVTNGAFGNACLSQSELNELPSNEQNNKCYKNWVTVMSLGNKQKEDGLLVAQSFLNVISIFIIIVLFQKFRLNQRNIDIKCDENDVQANDYTALFSHIPKKINYKGDPASFNYPEILRQYFQQNLLPDREVEIVQVGLCFNCDKITEKGEKLNTLILQKQVQILQGRNVSEWDDKIMDIQQKKRKLQLSYCDQLTQKFIEENFTGYAYVIFQKEKDKEDVIKHYERKSLIEQLLLQQKNKAFIYEQQRIYIVQAPDPNNINWKCLKFSSSQKLIRRILFFFLTIICLGACLSIIMGLNFAQKSVDSGESDNKSSVSLISIVISITISILNPILRKIIILISKKEGRSTKTSLFVSIAIRSALAQFLNTSILLIFTQVLIVNEGSVYGKIFGRGGLALNINTVFLTQMIISNLAKAIHLEFIIQKITRDTLSKYIEKIKLISQGQLNALFEYPVFGVEEEYARNLETVYSVLFYAPVFPICLVWGIVTLFLRYWIDKYNLMHKSTVKFNPSLQLCLQMTECLEYSLPIYSLANMLGFIYINDGEVSSLSIFGFLIGLLHAFLPMQILNERVFITRDRVANECTYSEVCDYFSMDYDRENPVINDIAIEQHIFRVKSQVSHVQNSRKEFLKNIATYQTTNMEKSQKNEESPDLHGEPILRNDIESNNNVFSLYKDPAMNKDTELAELKGYQRTSSVENPILKKKLSQFNPNREQTPKKVQILIEDSQNLINKEKNAAQNQDFNYETENNLKNKSSKQTQNNNDNNGTVDNQQYTNMKNHKNNNNSNNNSYGNQQNGNQIQIQLNQDLQNTEEIEDIDIYFQNIINHNNNATPKTTNTKQTSSSTKRSNNSVFTKPKKQQQFLHQVTLGQPYNDDFGFDSVRKESINQTDSMRGNNNVNTNNAEGNDDSSQRLKQVKQQSHKKHGSSLKKEEVYTDIINNQEAQVVMLNGGEDDLSEINSMH